MNTTTPESANGCPAHGNEDRRKSAALARKMNHCAEGAHWVQDPGIARKVMRSPHAVQAGASADMLNYKNEEWMPVFFLDGELHAKKRRTSLRFLSPKAVSEKHFDVMQRVTDELLGEFRQAGHAKLEDLSFRLAVEVVGVVLGLTESNQAGRVKRIQRVLHSSITNARNTALSRSWLNFKRAFFTGMFYLFDVRPAIKARRSAPRDDAISTYLDLDYPTTAIVVECLTYGTAGMLTTREFIIMAAWYLFEDEALRAQYLAGDEKEQLAILMEIVRLEPIAAKLMRRVDEQVDGVGDEPLPPGEMYDIDIRNLNVHEDLVGECPFAVDAQRAQRQKDSGRFFSFGDGPHSCPGSQVALQETRIFLQSLFQVPGLALEREPEITWNEMVHGYELRNAKISCKKETP
jgi:cytochrome P450